MFLPSLSRQTQLGAYPQDYTLHAYRVEAAVCRELPIPHLDPTIVVLRENKASTLSPLAYLYEMHANHSTASYPFYRPSIDQFNLVPN